MKSEVICQKAHTIVYNHALKNTGCKIIYVETAEEVENAINMHAGVVESAVVGYPHNIKGQGIYAYVIVGEMHGDESSMRQNILQTVTRVIGAIAKPDKIQFVKGLPKTRSGKIMRRILRKIAEGETQNVGDTTALLDPGVVEDIKDNRL